MKTMINIKQQSTLNFIIQNLLKETLSLKEIYEIIKNITKFPATVMKATSCHLTPSKSA